MLLVSACAGSTSEPPVTSVSTTDAAPVTSVVARTTTSTSLAVPATTTTFVYDPDDVSALAMYLASIERELEGTGMEGAAFEAPEALIDTGVLFCGLLDEEFSPTDVLRGWIAALSADGATPTDDDLLVGGVVLGAAVKFICPQYTEDLEL